MMGKRYAKSRNQVMLITIILAIGNHHAVPILVCLLFLLIVSLSPCSCERGGGMKGDGLFFTIF